MYDELFGLTGRPFQLTPDPAFWYETATHRRAMAYLGYGLAQGEGFIVITGDIGAGKTTLVGHLLDTLDREALNPIKLVSTAIEASDLLRIVATDLGVDPAGLEKAQLLTAIERGLHAVARRGRRTLLIVDEAQALPTGALEELRMLSNFQAGGHALLQIVLLGQPEFRAALHGSDRLEQLRQRVIAIHHLEPMGPGEVAAYVRHRLGVVGWSGTPDFADDAFAALHRHSDGVPRRLNQLANRVMLHAGIEGVATIDAATVDQVAADLFADLPIMAQPAPAAPVAEVVEERAPVEPAPVELAPVELAEAVEVESVAAELPEPAPEPEPEPVAVADRVVRPFRHSWLEAVSHSLAAPTSAPAHAGAQSEERSACDPGLLLSREHGHPDADGSSVDAVQPVELAKPVIDLPPEPVVEEAAPVAPSEPEPVVSHEAATAADPDPAFAARFAELEARLEEQDAALRRVLTLLVDWVEGDQAAKPAPVDARALIDEPRGYVPIRGAAA